MTANLPRWVSSYPEGLQWDSNIEVRPATALLEESAAQFPQNPCVDFLGYTLTYAQMLGLVNRLAAGLQAYGIQKGDRIALFMPNCPYYVAAYYAALKVGAVVVNLNPLYAPQEMEHHFKDSAPRLLFTLDLAQFHGKLRHVLEKCPHLENLVVCSLADVLPPLKSVLYRLFKRGDIAKWSKGEPKHLGWDELLAAEGAQPAPVAIDPLNDLAVLQYTGGTTGVAKGAMLTHYNIYANACQSALWFQGAKVGQERMLGVLPLFHVFAMTVIMNMTLKLGGMMILLPKFDLNEALSVITTKKPTLFPAVPTIFTAIVNHGKLGKYTLSSIQKCISGGAPLPLETKSRFEALTGCVLVEGYGLSETSPVASCNPMFGLNKTGSIGLPLPQTHFSIRSLDDPMQEVAVGARGEVCIKGPQLMKGYWNRPDETAKVILPDGFLRTGDVGIMDEQGYISIVDRIKDMILCSGYNVYPRNVEEAIYQHPAVKETIVLGVPDPYRGQTVKAYVTRKDGASLGEIELLEFLKERLSPMEMPKMVEFRASLPKTMIGKLSRKELYAEMERNKPAGA